DLLPAQGCRAWQCCNLGKRTVQLSRRFYQRRALQGPLSYLAPQHRGLLHQAGFRAMMRQQLWPALGNLYELAFKDFGNTGVKLTSGLSQQRGIRGVLHQGMLEQVAGMRLHALAGQQACMNKAIERRFQLLSAFASNRSQYGMRKLPTNRRPNLRHLLGGAE